MSPEKKPSRSFWLWGAIGPAIITASVVLGPGSILASSKIGYQHGYAMIWVLAIAVALMISMTALSARLGVLLDGTLCDELARREGRWLAAVTGVSLFLIAACFQFGNNLGVLAAIEPLVEQQQEKAAAARGGDQQEVTADDETGDETDAGGDAADDGQGADESAADDADGEEEAGGGPPQEETAAPPAAESASGNRGWLAAKIGVIVGLNVLVIIALFGFQRLYKPMERLMKALVTLMIIGFAANLVWARPDWLAAFGGLRPRLPEGAASTLLPRVEEAVMVDGEVLEPAKIIDHLIPVIAMFATTFSVAGAFYQSYLVRKKGWTRDNLREGLVDSTVGICVLGLVTLMIMVTAASVLHGKPDVGELNTAADVARQLSPLFGPTATALFCMGIFAGAFSSFLVNAMIGGTVLSDGLGLGGDIDGRWPKVFTVLGLLMGMGVAIWVEATGQRPVNLIIFAQAMTVLGLPALAVALVYLATREDLRGERAIPLWMKVVAVATLLIVTFLAVRTGLLIYLRLTV